jgi:hypothetical protein
MGAGSSVPSREEFEKTTKQGTSIVSRLFQWLLKESNLIDLYALAAPSECQKYVAFTTEGLNKFFKELQIEPKRDKSGALYFQRTSNLAKMSREAVAEQQQYCTQISFFFIRILQIYAALTLSVLDSDIPLTTEKMEQFGKAIAETKKEQIGPEQLRRIPLFSAPTVAQKGGTIPPSKKYYITDINYSILNRYLEIVDEQRFTLKDGEKDTRIYIPYDYIYPVAKPTLLYKGRDENDEPITIQARLQIERFQTNVEGKIIYRVTLKPVLRNGKDIQIYSLDKIVPREKGKIGPVDFKSMLGDEPVFNSQTIPRFIKNEFNRILGKPVEDIEDGEIRGKKVRSFEDIPFGDIPQGLQLKSIWQGMKSPVKSYCVARALQLLSPEGIYGTSGRATVSVCDKDFAFYRKHSLPTPEAPIFDAAKGSTGLLTLNLLFFDMLEKTTPMISKETGERHKTFLREMKFLFEELESVPTSDVAAESIKDVTPKVCTGSSKFLVNDKDILNALRVYVGQLLYRQMRHTKDVLKILGKLFLLSENGPWLLHPNIEKGGMREVENIAAEARELLENYYKDCETTYREGVVYLSKKKVALTKPQ